MTWTRYTVFFCLSLSALAQTDLTGKWDVTATPEGKKPIKLGAVLDHNGQGLTGTVTSSIGSGPVQNASINSPDLTFQFLLGKYVFDVKATATDDEIRGTFSGPRNMKGEFLARRNGAPPTLEPAAGVEIGTLGEAAYRIDIPNNHNGSLVIYCHGYSFSPGTFRKDKEPNALTKAFLDLGYAVAQSGYSKGGWAVKEAIEESEALRKFYVRKYGKPRQTYVMGHSMGGTITLATIETFPDAYDGALQMCGPLAPSLQAFQRRVFDTLVVYDYFFPGIIGSPVEFSENVRQDPEFALQIQKEMQVYYERGRQFQRWGNFHSDTEAAQTVAFYALIQKELLTRAGGNAFDNRNTLYQGADDDIALNRGVKRYTADPAAVDYLTKYYTPTAAPKKPILSLHTIYDPLVPAWQANAYGEALRLNGGDQLFVQRFVARNGHCSFSPEQTVNAFKDLVSWKETGVRPEAGEQK